MGYYYSSKVTITDANGNVLRPGEAVDQLKEARQTIDELLNVVEPAKKKGKRRKSNDEWPDVIS